MLANSQPASPYCLVTGASQGIGRAIADECARRGMNLVLVDLPQTGLAELCAELAERHGINAEGCEADLTDSVSPERIHRFVQSRGFEIGVLVNNAGLSCTGLFDHRSPDVYDSLIRLNISAVVRMTHRFLPDLRRRSRAYILNVSSLSAFQPMPHMAVYGASKRFVMDFSRALRQELKDSTVSVSVLCPSGVPTNEYCQAMIAAQGPVGRLTCSSAETVARYAIKHTLRGEAVIVPGWINRAIRRAWGFTPLSLSRRIVGRRFGEVDRIMEEWRERT